MNNIKYTFLLPAYKARFFEEALRSIKNQTYKDFKVIVSDDCSPEDLKSIYDKVCTDDPRFTFRRNEENMGSKSLVSHWNLLVDMCDTEFFIMASDDDAYEPHFLAEIDVLTQKYPNTYLFRGRCKSINEEGHVLQKEYIYEEYWNQHNFYRIYFNPMFMYSEANYVYHTKTFMKEDGYIDFPLAWFTDSATHLKMARNGIANTPDITFLSRVSTINITRNDSKEIAIKKLDATFQFLDWVKAFHNKLGDYSEECYLMQYALHDCQYEIKLNIIKYLPKCHICKFIHYMCIAHKKLCMSRLNMIYDWVKLHILR